MATTLPRLPVEQQIGEQRLEPRCIDGREWLTVITDNKIAQKLNRDAGCRNGGSRLACWRIHAG